MCVCVCVYVYMFICVCVYVCVRVCVYVYTKEKNVLMMARNLAHPMHSGLERLHLQYCSVSSLVYDMAVVKLGLCVVYGLCH